MYTPTIDLREAVAIPIHIAEQMTARMSDEIVRQLNNIRVLRTNVPIIGS
jgi:hypothetical protein